MYKRPRKTIPLLEGSPAITTPPSVAGNILANFAGRGWAGIINLAVVPLYIKFLGIEAYGLIGIYYSLMAILAVLDLGLSSTLSRELARLSAVSGNEQEARDLVRTMEIVYWSIGILISGIILLLAPLVAYDWVRGKGIPPGTINKAFMIMGCIIAFEWPAALYSGGMIGLQRQAPFNAIRAAFATVQAMGAVMILWMVSPSIIAYFLWQIFLSLSQTLVLRNCLWRYLPEGTGADCVRKELLKKNWRFAAGMTGISLMATILTQLDKVLLSKFLSLEAFGYYILAFNVATTLNNLVQPVFAGLFPKLSQVVFENDEKEVSALYHKGCQLMAVIVVPTALTLALFSRDVLTLWLRNDTIVSNTHLLLSLILIGTLLNGIMTLPYMLQLAYGWTKLSFYKNVVAVIVLIPVLPLMIRQYGAYGAAIVWIMLNAGYFLIEIPLMHRKLLKGAMWAWLKIDIGLPILITSTIVLVARAILPTSAPLYIHGIWIILTFIAAAAISSVSLPGPREWLKRGLISCSG